MQRTSIQSDSRYRVGGLLYTPASDKKIAQRIISHEYQYLTSIALCLEDSISDEGLPLAEKQLKDTLNQLKTARCELPMIFVRVRSSEHLKHIHSYLRDEESVLTGYIFPKFDLSNCSSYCDQIRAYNEHRVQTLYMMPILESRAVADIGNRVDILWEIKRNLDEIKQYVLNIRVGGNDLSNMYGLRRTETQTIYDIGVIRDILVNIINVFASDYIVSGPVWEYFGSDSLAPWSTGLMREIELDLLNGFFGKTAIHPLQLPIIFNSLKVTRRDYEDSLQILDWQDHDLGVAKGTNGDRMNEVKCHSKWAERIVARAAAYGIRDE